MSAQAAATTDPIEQIRRYHPETLHAWQQRAMPALLGIVLDRDRGRGAVGA